MTLPRIIPVWTGDFSPAETVLTTPMTLIDRTPALCALLAACGVPADVSAPDGRAPDYDYFASVVGSLPLLPGHPAAACVRRLLAALGCPRDADAPALWHCLADRMGPAAPEPVTVQTLADALGETPAVPLRPEQALIGRRGLLTAADVEAALAAALIDADGMILTILPVDYTFTRPNPYTTGLLLRKAEADSGFSWDALTVPERDHLLSQVIRTVGSLCRREGRVMHIAGADAQLCPVIDCLAGAGCLPDVVRLLRDPASSGDPLPPVPGADVRTGLWLPGDAAPADLRACLAAYAERMPFGCADGLYVPVGTPMQLTQPAEVRRAAEALTEIWERDQRKD